MPKRKPKKSKLASTKPAKPTLSQIAVKRELITPERARHAGNNIEAVGADKMSGRGETTIRVRSSPLDRLYHHKPQAITREQYDAGTKLYELYMASGLHQIRAQDLSRPTVDCAPTKRGIELQLDAVTRYTGAIGGLLPNEFKVVKAVVIEESDIMPMADNYRGRDSRISGMTLLRNGLDRIAIFLGIAEKPRIAS